MKLLYRKASDQLRGIHSRNEHLSIQGFASWSGPDFVHTLCVAEDTTRGLRGFLGVQKSSLVILKDLVKMQNMNILHDKYCFKLWIFKSQLSCKFTVHAKLPSLDTKKLTRIWTAIMLRTWNVVCISLRFWKFGFKAIL